MTRWHNHYLDGHPHFCTATVSGWRPLLSGNAIATLYREWAAVRRALGVKVLAYVVMPEHFHVVLWSESDERVCRFLQRTLGLTSETFQPGGGFWKERPRVLPVRSEKMLKTKVDYLHANPVRRNPMWHSRPRLCNPGPDNVGAVHPPVWGKGSFTLSQAEGPLAAHGRGTVRAKCHTSTRPWHRSRVIFRSAGEYLITWCEKYLTSAGFSASISVALKAPRA